MSKKKLKDPEPNEIPRYVQFPLVTTIIAIWGFTAFLGFCTVIIQKLFFS